LGITTLGNDSGHRSVACHERIMRILRTGDVQDLDTVMCAIMQEMQVELLRGVSAPDGGKCGPASEALTASWWGPGRLRRVYWGIAVVG